jgi:flagellar basal-body rod protein FlgB
MDSMQINQLLEAGITAEGARQKAISNNIANMNSPDYRRMDIRFEDILNKMLSSSDGDIKSSELEPEYYQPKMTQVKSNGNDVTLDVEVGEMVKNSLRHRTYMSLLKKKYQQMSLAIR